MGDPFARAAASLLARLGQEAVLRSGEATRVRVERGVEVLGEYGEVVGHRVSATLPSAIRPRKGDRLAVGADLYFVDAIGADDGHLVECTVRSA
ncbi:MAG: hypothetical protein KDH20_22390 [Rhodocyclaceae bacterium]|nr:hypothetical protein [Rhodocyclaceae bacterium]